MITLHTLKPSRTRTKYKRVGRGNSSGKGTTAGRGTKGQRARTGGRNKLTRRGLKHLIERTPKTRGFRSLRGKLQVVNLAEIEHAFDEGAVIRQSDLAKRGLIRSVKPGVKVLGTGPMKKKLTIMAEKFSESAQAAIKTAGGTAVVSQPKPSTTKT